MWHPSHSVRRFVELSFVHQPKVSSERQKKRRYEVGELLAINKVAMKELVELPCEVYNIVYNMLVVETKTLVLSKCSNKKRKPFLR